MSWNYRIFHRTVTDPAGQESDEFTIREAYYDDAGRVTSWTSEPVRPYGETLLDLNEDVYAMVVGLTKPAVRISADCNTLAEGGQG